MRQKFETTVKSTVIGLPYKCSYILGDEKKGVFNPGVPRLLLEPLIGQLKLRVGANSVCMVSKQIDD